MQTLSQDKIDKVLNYQTERDFLRDNWDDMTIIERMVFIRLFNAIDTLKSENDMYKMIMQEF
jgi:hypothetical protein